jgi:GntR family transcriptional regulator/MocR family aminotransferase
VAIQWSGLGPELLLRLDRDSGLPLRSQLEDGIRDAIRDGRLQPGERLPSSREFARELGVSRGLVQECYGQLLSEGYLDSQVGSATRVAARAYPAASRGGLAGASKSGLGGASKSGLAEASRAPRPAVAAPAASRLIADFRSGVPDLASFPRSDWVWAMREACREVATADLDYGDPRGSRALREVLAGYLRRVRAAAVVPDDLIVCTGFAQGLNLVLEVLSQLGVRRVAFEDPGYGDDETSTSVRSAALAGAPAVRVPVDDLGIDVAALAASETRAVVVTPAHQSPTGVVLAPARRHALAEWASRHDGYIVEDDYDSEFRYDREPVGVLQGIAPDRVFTVGTVSKSLAPSVRLGWVIAPPALSGAVAEAKLLSDRGTSGLDQLALAALLRSGRYDRHLRKMRGVYARRREVLIRALGRHAPGTRLTGLAAGFHAVAHLPAAADEGAVVAEALRRSVGLYGMAPFRATRGAAPPQLVLGFGLTGERAIEAGIAAVADLLR